LRFSFFFFGNITYFILNKEAHLKSTNLSFQEPTVTTTTTTTVAATQEGRTSPISLTTATSTPSVTSTTGEAALQPVAPPTATNDSPATAVNANANNQPGRTSPPLVGGGAPTAAVTTATTNGMAGRREKNQKSKKGKSPKLTLLCVRGETVTECSFDTHTGNRITFQFGIKEDSPEDIAQKMVGNNFSLVCLSGLVWSVLLF